MKQIKVKDIAISLKEYATVKEDATLYEAIKILKDAQRKYLRNILDGQEIKYPHRAILVVNEDGEVVGKLSQLDILRSLEPKYAEIMKNPNVSKLAASGFSAEFLEGLIEKFNLFSYGFRDLCQKTAQSKVKDFMYTPTEGEFVREYDTLDIAVHKLVLGHHQSLLVVNEDSKIVGILRLVDVFEVIALEIESCAI